MSSVPITSWVAVSRSSAIRAKPLCVMFDGKPLVLFRSGGNLHCLTDRCPHRGAPLSAGRVVDGTLECPYHGWRFDGSGLCRCIPAAIDGVPRIAVPSHPVIEKAGLIFVSAEPCATPPYTAASFGIRTASVIVESQVMAALADVAENILDAPHTHFVHKGILRGLSAKRYRVTVTVTGGDGWVEARYEGEPRQEGLVSRLLEGQRSVSIGRFIFPGIAELEFWGPNRLQLATTFHLRQAGQDIVHGFGILTGPKQAYLERLKLLILKPFFRIAVRQDRSILEASHRNSRFFPDRGSMTGPADAMRPHIDAILAGRRPSVAGSPLTLTMLL